jgi:hypothetical protein
MNCLRFIRKINLFLLFTFFLCHTSSADYQIKGDDIRLDTSVFSGILSSEDTTPQKAFEKIDKIDIEGFPDDGLLFIIDGRGAAITAGSSGSKIVPYNCTITGWEVISNVSGSIVVTVNKSTTTSPTAPSWSAISGTEKPTLSSAVRNSDTVLSTWNTSIAAGNQIQAVVDSADINGVVMVILYLTKT